MSSSTGPLPRGVLAVGRIGSTRLLLHWSAPLVPLLWGGFTADWWGMSGMVVVLLVHAFGHILVARRESVSVSWCVIDGTGGQVQRRGRTPRPQALRVAWGGTLAQLGLLLLSGMIRLIWPSVNEAGYHTLFDALVFGNTILILLNLLPFQPFDGADGWGMLDRHLDRKVPGPKQPTPEVPSVDPIVLEERSAQLLDQLMQEVRSDLRKKKTGAPSSSEES